jgi:CRISPR-associated endonuclease/helicase Cas3
LYSVAKSAAAKADKFGAADSGFWAGLLHDLGKFHPDFQDYIRDPEGRRGPDHSSAGAVLAGEFWPGLSFPLAGHHGGLADLADLKDWLHKKKTDPAVNEAIKSARQALVELRTPTSPSDKPFARIENNELQFELFIRLLFSALVDADFLDTERHFSSQRNEERMALGLQSGRELISELWRRFETNPKTVTNNAQNPESGTVNYLRQEIYQACLRAADEPPGVFRLTVPTGGGKTRSGMAFALRHALRHGLERVIVAIPYTSIIEQNADEYRDIFGAEAVLEHHSAITFKEDREDLSPDEMWSRLASENWDAPVVVTTTVQLFESLFANRTTRCRKLHNLVKSVLILDEVQTLPVELLEPIVNVLQDLSDNYQVTVVLCTATQPALDDSPYLRGLKNIHEIVPEPERYFAALRRVHYELPARTEEWSWERVATEMRTTGQCLAVVDTKKDALALLDALNDPNALHLSTLLCGAHRRQVITEVRHRLKAGKPCRLVSTQVVEAGVDLDFPMVLRTLGPLDRIVQAAGRCNREGRLADAAGRPTLGRVVIFQPAEGHLPRGPYRSGTDQAKSLLGRKDADLHDPSLYKQYFQQFYQLVEKDVRGIQKLRKNLCFAGVAEKFRIIPENTVPVLVRYLISDQVKIENLVSDIRAGRGLKRKHMRQLQPYLVNIYQSQVPRLQKQGLIIELAEGLYEWLGSYDSVRGIRETAQDPERLIC